MTKVLEHAEHTQHAGHSGDIGKFIGLTMAVIGVLVAICGALIGGARNEMTRAMILQTQATSDAASASTKYRIVLVNVENLRGASAIPQPVRERFVRLYADYAEERQTSAERASSYAPLIDAFFEATEGYEVAQLLAEIGIITASLAVLLSNRPAWYVAIVFGLMSVGQIGRTYISSSSAVHKAEAFIHVKDSAYREVRRAHSDDKSDIEAIAAIDPDGSLLKRATESAKATSGATGKDATGH